jgi:hypothetical protein
MIQSLVYSSMTNHITRWNPAVSTIPILLKPQLRSSPWSNHILTDGRPALIKIQANLNITKDGKTCTHDCMLGITNEVWSLGSSIKACRPMCILEREREHIGSIWSRVTCLALLLATAQSLEHRAPGDSRSLQWLTVANGSKQHKQIYKQYNKQCLITKQTVPKDATHRYEHVSVRITEIRATVKKL